MTIDLSSNLPRMAAKPWNTKNKLSWGDEKSSKRCVVFVVSVFLSCASVIVFSLGFRFIVRLLLCRILTYFTIENCRTFWMTELNVWKEKLRNF